MPAPDTRTPYVARQQREQSQRRSDRVDPRHDYRMPEPPVPVSRALIAVILLSMAAWTVIAVCGREALVLWGWL
jgi:hypothetical protein